MPTLQAYNDCMKEILVAIRKLYPKKIDAHDLYNMHADLKDIARELGRPYKEMLKEAADQLPDIPSDFQVILHKGNLFARMHEGVQMYRLGKFWDVADLDWLKVTTWLARVTGYHNGYTERNSALHKRYTDPRITRRAGSTRL